MGLPPPCGNATTYINTNTFGAGLLADDDGDYRASMAASGAVCPYHDTPLQATTPTTAATAPFWASAENIEASEYVRVLCMSYDVTDDNAGTITKTTVAHECQVRAMVQ